MSYTIYGNQLSYFTRKLEAAMIFYGAPFELAPEAAGSGAAVGDASDTGAAHSGELDDWGFHTVDRHAG
ncbi:MAG: hypothetical protein U5O39_00110 [Gammaproteobacteria bacterium]|nr:hypothetical protein [Gammaproteobacteria bacterium]